MDKGLRRGKHVSAAGQEDLEAGSPALSATKPSPERSVRRRSILTTLFY